MVPHRDKFSALPFSSQSPFCLLPCCHLIGQLTASFKIASVHCAISFLQDGLLLGFCVSIGDFKVFLEPFVFIVNSYGMSGV